MLQLISATSTLMPTSWHRFTLLLTYSTLAGLFPTNAITSFGVCLKFFMVSLVVSMTARASVCILSIIVFYRSDWTKNGIMAVRSISKINMTIKGERSIIPTRVGSIFLAKS